jgi:diaminopimelate decarboxylase/aspartate kinase
MANELAGTGELSEARFGDSASLGAPGSIANSKWVVMKFGGTSVSSAANWKAIAGRVRDRLDAGLQIVVVHSALKGVSNALEEILQSAIGGNSSEYLATLKQQHYELADALGLDGPPLLDEAIQELQQLISGVRLVREVSVRVRVRVMALGEIMATRLGAAYLTSAGIDVHWQDARDILTSETRANRSVTQSYLSATCSYDADPELASELSGHAKVILTQGFIARNSQKETVLLGRGGSDTSAAYFAAKLQAGRLEIWTDVPGMFTADPKLVPSARLLVALHFDEAQELASTGSRVLHPRCLSPLRRYGIPLFIRCTTAPHISGTVISSVTSETEPQVKGIASRNGLTLVSMDGVGMWHEVGFLADAFSCFKSHGVSVDLVSTSETNVTVSIDTVDGMLAEDTEQALVTDLAPLCLVKVIRNCAAVSLVGRKIRTILPRIAPALEAFEEEKIHLVSQAANDLNFSFVIEQDQVPKLVAKLHASIIRKSGGSPAFGSSWEALFQGEPADAVAEPPWWLQKRDDLLQLANEYFNAYVYDGDSVRRAADCLLSMPSLDRVLYAVKANFNAELLKILAGAGVDFECVSPGEVDWLFDVMPDLDKGRILFTPNFAPRTEYEWAVEKRLQLTLDNLHPLKAWPEVFRGQKLFIRVDPGQGRGHHEHVKTAGVHSKFGIPRFEVDELVDLLSQVDAEVIGIHAHSGSGILDPDNWRSVAAELIKVAERFPSVEVLDLGGGLGIPEKQ